MNNATIHIPGEKIGEILVFTLSTCIWCKMTKSLLDKYGIEYNYVDMDRVEDEARIQLQDELTKWNPRNSYPTIIINNSICIQGYNENEIKAALRIK